MKIILLIRSYNRYKYFKKTIESLNNSDLNLFTEKIIYDDNSNEIELLNFYKTLKDYKIILSKINRGCKNSLLNLLKNLEFDYLCLLDDDVLVKKNFANILFHTYQKIQKNLKTENILLTGFNPTNVYRDCIIKMFSNYHIKKNCGAINYFFHKNLKEIIIKGWENNLDHGVAEEFKKRKDHHICCLNKGVIQHIGFKGLNSDGKRYDYDKDFIIS